MALSSLGSTWNKWDLHVHTPYSHVSGYGNPNDNATWERFISELEALPKEFKVLGINDYFFIEGYKRLKNEKEKNGRLANIELLLPVIELRIRNFSGSSELRKINFHAIFSNQLDVAAIEQNFLGKLELEYKKDGSEQWVRYFSRAHLEEFGQRIKDDAPEEKKADYGSAFETGANNATFDLDAINKLLAHNTFEGHCFTAIGKAEWSSHTWTQAIADKKRLINGVDLVFTASKAPQDCAESRETLKTNRVKSKVIHCSDAHFYSDSDQHNKIGHCFCWIKSDTEFVGLKYALEDYDARVFIGELPPKLGLVKARPTKFIHSIEIKKKQNSSFNEVWFNHEIKLNHDLVAIVGNKGSGKSALADILGLLGNTQNYEHFSFLSDERFRDPKTKKASHFFGKLVWESGPDPAKNLDQDPDLFDFEKVKYLPQSYLEKICNEVNVGKETEFDKEIKNVIFSHIPDAEKISKYTFDDLVAYKTEESNKRISQLRIELSASNRNIANLEVKSTAEEVEKIKNLIKKKQSELEAHIKAKPPAVNAPAADRQNQTVNAQIVQKNSELEKVKADLELSRIAKSTETIRQAKLVRILESLESFSNYAGDFQESLAEDLHDFGLSASQIVEVKIDLEPIQNELKRATQKINALNQKLAPIVVGSFASIEVALLKEIDDLRKKLDEPNQKFQAYMKALAVWDTRRKEIEGSSDLPNSLKYYEQQLENTSSYAEEIKQLRLERVATVKKIFAEVQRLAKVLASFYEPVKTHIAGSKTNITNFDFQFSVETSIGGFVDRFLDWIDNRVAGHFSGIEGRKALTTIAKSYVFDSEDQVVKFLSEVYLKLTADPHAPNKHAIQQQLKPQKMLAEFYDFLFSLDYMRPRYSLKSGDKELSQLSPGQKGLLLLSFYLIVDNSDIPLVIDQPEENLDNHTVYDLLVPYISQAKSRRQIVIVTHNPNLAIVCDAEQIIWCSLDVPDGNRISYEAGSIENAILNKRVVDVLEGTHKAFNKRKRKYLALLES